MVYFSATGNTKTVAEMFPSSLYDIVEAKSLDKSTLINYNVIVLGMSTWSRGMPPKVFINLLDDFLECKHASFYLFGSGRIEYEHYCGALDFYKYSLLCGGCTVIGGIKFEGYPTVNTFIKAHRFITRINEKLEE